jgi:hypothetical protein
MQPSTEPTQAAELHLRGDDGELYRRHHHDLRRAVTHAVNAPSELIVDACQNAWTIMLRAPPERASSRRRRGRAAAPVDASPRSDVALALVLGVLCLQSVFGDHGLNQPGWAVVLLIELSVLPLAVRSSRPLEVLATTLAAAIIGDLDLLPAAAHEPSR